MKKWLVSLVLLSLFSVIWPTRVRAEVGVKCGWACTPGGAVCKPNKAGDTYTWIGWCGDGSRGICVDKCIGSINTTVYCNGHAYAISCPSYTKVSNGCCNNTRPTVTPTPTPSPTPTIVISPSAPPQAPWGEIQVNPKTGIATEGDWCHYHVFFEWNSAVEKAKVTYQTETLQGQSQGEITWCAPNHNDCRFWSPISRHQPVEAKTLSNQRTIYRLYALTPRGQLLLSTDSFQCNSPSPTPSLTPSPSPSATPTPLPTLTPSPTPTPTPIPRWKLIDGQAHSANGFPQAEIINQNLPPLLTYQTPLSYTIAGEEPIIQGSIFEDGSYTNLLQTSFLSSFNSLSQQLAPRVKLEGKETFTSQEVNQAISLSQQNSGTILINGNLEFNQLKNTFKHFLFLVRGETKLTTDIRPTEESFLISKGPIQIASNVSHLRGVFISYSGINSQATTLQLQGGIIAKNSIGLSLSNGSYTIQPDNKLLFDLVTSPFFTSKNFRIFYLQEKSPQF